MKKILFALALASASVASYAQTDVPTVKYSVATNSFWSNWFVQAGAAWNAWYSGEEHGSDLKKSPFKKFRTHPGASVALGKWFTPGIGLRTKLQGVWGNTVRSDGQSHLNRYWLLNEHVMFNLSNLICGYNENRLFNLIPFVGGGVGRSMTYNLYSMDLSAGVQAQFRICKKFAVYAELGWNRLESDIDGGTIYDTNVRGWDTHDNNLYAELGFNYNLGKATWNAVPDVDALMAQNQAALDALNAKLRDAENENANLRNQLKNQPKVETVSQSVKELITTPISVFFNLDKIDIASQKDLVNVRAIAKYAKDNDRNLLVTGYADSATGSAAHNQELSENRAKTVAEELQKMGVDASKITTVGKGGVETLSPVSFNRRATVQVAE